jgi:WhiB family redox-sensing transcriptional regulator
MIARSAIDDWRETAACSGYDPEIWFVEDDRAALSVCTSCSVREACLTAALLEERGSSAAYRHGVRGGLSPQSRAQLDKMAGTRRAAQMPILRSGHACPDCGQFHPGQRRRCAVCFERLRRARG